MASGCKRDLVRHLGRQWRVLAAAKSPALPGPQGCRSFSAEVGAEGQRKLIKQLRERTGAPMKDVKATLVQCQWDSEAAFTELRKKGLAAASKKASRIAAEGLLGVGRAPGTVAVVEINSETDFVARNDIFQHLVSRVAVAALSADSLNSVGLQPETVDLQSLEAAKVILDHPKLSGESSVRDAVAETAGMLGENVKLRRCFRVTSPGFSGVYLHDSPLEGLGRIAGVLTLDVEGGFLEEDATEFEPYGNLLAMHIVAAKPLFLSRDHVDPQCLQQERDVLQSQALASGKKQAFIDKMVEGRLKKYYEEVALLDQKFVVNDTQTVQAVLDELSGKVGKPVSIGQFLRMAVGEGVERQEKDFAAEVSAQQLKVASQ